MKLNPRIFYVPRGLGIKQGIWYKIEFELRIDSSFLLIIPYRLSLHSCPSALCSAQIFCQTNYSIFISFWNIRAKLVWRDYIPNFMRFQISSLILGITKFQKPNCGAYKSRTTHFYEMRFFFGKKRSIRFDLTPLSTTILTIFNIFFARIKVKEPKQLESMDEDTTVLPRI